MLCFLGEREKGNLSGRRSPISDENYVEGSQTGATIQVKQYTPEDIKAMTRNFSDKKRVAENKFARLYKCSPQKGEFVAVKQLKPEAIQEESKFMAQIRIMERANHPNLNPLLGYCCTKDFQTLVFKFAQNNNLSCHLHSKFGLSWDNRVKIAIGVARALSYLHNECDPPIAHKDIKPANILLSSTFEAQVSDFGFTKLEDMANPVLFTWTLETPEYIAPEFEAGFNLTEKSDVYSFGIVLIEILSGRIPKRSMYDENLCIESWAKEHMKVALETGNFSKLVDSKLQGAYNEDDVYKMVEAIAKCILVRSEARPTMEEVLNILQGEANRNYRLVRSERSLKRDAVLRLGRKHFKENKERYDKERYDERHKHKAVCCYR